MKTKIIKSENEVIAELREELGKFNVDFNSEKYIFIENQIRKSFRIYYSSNNDKNRTHIINGFLSS